VDRLKKIENPDNLPERKLLGVILKNII